MESAIACDLVSSLMDMGYRVNTITMDDDTTTISRLQKNVDPQIKKHRDRTHVKKNFKNSLFDVKDEHKQLTTDMINYFVSCSSYAIAQNKDDEVTLASRLSSIVPHAFGDHNLCDASWCGYLKCPETYKHTGLPGGRDMSGAKLKKDMESAFKRFAEKPDLANCGSTQANESLNHIIGTKVPKSKHFGSSESANFRIAAGVAQGNIGRDYVVKVSFDHQEQRKSP